MSYQISSISAYSIGGIKGLLSNGCGYSIHPITYKNQKYIVDFEYTPVCLYDDDIGFLARIYPYHEKFNLFAGHKGKRLYQRDITTLILADGKKYKLRSASLDTIKSHLPEIMQIIFGCYEDALQRQNEKQAAIRTAEAWDGVIR